MQDSIMNARKIHDEKAIARETFAQQAAHANAEVSVSPPPGDTVTRVDTANLIRALQQLEAIAKQQAPRIAFKAKGRILFLDLAEIIAVQAEGNYVSLQHRPNPYLLRESLSSMAEKLRPYGFIRIHRSVVVNVSAVEEIRPLPTGEYSLRVKGGKEYLVTRTYKDNLRDLAQLWVGSGGLPG
jgi:DNA-binding LytR/AlgR family response regulator